VIALAGDADRFRTDEVSAAISAARKDGLDIVVDISDVAFIDPAMLSLFVSASEVAARHGESLVIVSGGPRFRRSIQIKGLETLLTVTDSRDEAFASLGR
jgi:anti-anti-sigma factor